MRKNVKNLVLEHALYCSQKSRGGWGTDASGRLSTPATETLPLNLAAKKSTVIWSTRLSAEERWQSCLKHKCKVENGDSQFWRQFLYNSVVTGRRKKKERTPLQGLTEMKGHFYLLNMEDNYTALNITGERINREEKFDQINSVSNNPDP